MESFGHVQRKVSGYTGQRWMDMELPRRRKTGKAQRRFPDVMKEDMQRVGVKKKAKMETDDQQWRPLKGASEKKKGAARFSDNASHFSILF